MLDDEVAERVAHERAIPRFASQPCHWLSHMRVRPQHDVDAQICEQLRVVQLVLIWLDPVLSAPVHGYEHDVGKLLRAWHVLSDAVLVNEVHGIIGNFASIEAAQAVGVVQESERDTLALDDWYFVRFVPVGSCARESDRLRVPDLPRVLDRTVKAPVV